MKYPLVVFLIAFGVDQGSKYLIQQRQGIILNDGVSFGLFAFLSPFVLHIVSLFIIFYLLWQFAPFWKRHPFASSLFFAGAFSNSLDRIWWSGVRDWLPIPGFSLYNNLADWYIAVSLIYLAIIEMRKKYV